MDFRSCAVAALLAFVAAAGSAAARPSPTTASASSVEALKLGEFDEPITIPVRWMDTDKVFVFDTGCTRTILDETWFGKLRATDHTAVNVLSGPKEVDVVDPPELQVGPFWLPNCGPATRMDLASVRIGWGLPVIGVIGANAVKDLVVQIDFDAREVRLMRPDDKPRAEWGEVMPMEIAGECPAVQLVVDGHEELFGIDTGCVSQNVLRQGLFKELLPTTHPVVSVPTFDAARSGENRLLRVRSLRYGNFESKGLLFMEGSGMSQLGTAFLFGNLVTLDFPAKRVYLRPTKESERRESNMCGMGLGRVGAETRAMGVRLDGPAYASGIREQDVILEIEGTPTNAVTLSQARRLLRGSDGAVVVVKYRRGAGIADARVVLKRIF